jgi:uncharacterized membrane protein YeaQ/YmgE (transglycosylase-associated protein family)
MDMLAVLILVAALVLGGATGWIAGIHFKADVRMPLMVNVAVGAAGSSCVALASGLHAESVPYWVVAVAAVLGAAWLIGIVRAALGLYLASSAWR